MELRKNSLNPNQHAPRGLEDLADAIRSSKEMSRAAMEHLAAARERASGQASAMSRGAHADRVELSASGRLFSVDSVDADETRASLVDSLRAAYQDGTLNTRDRIEAAASRLLGGE